MQVAALQATVGNKETAAEQLRALLADTSALLQQTQQELLETRAGVKAVTAEAASQQVRIHLAQTQRRSCSRRLTQTRDGAGAQQQLQQVCLPLTVTTWGLLQQVQVAWPTPLQHQGCACGGISQGRDIAAAARWPWHCCECLLLGCLSRTVAAMSRCCLFGCITQSGPSMMLAPSLVRGLRSG